MRDLLERVKAAGPELTSYDRIGYDALVLLLGRDEAHGWLYHSKQGDPAVSVDAALALVERVLPGWFVGLQQNNRHGCDEVPLWSAYLEPRVDGSFEAGGTTPPLALLAALLSALMATAEETDAKPLTHQPK